MKTLTFTIVLMLATVFGSFAAPKAESSAKKTETNISGIVKDAQTGETLAGVEVCLEGTDMKTYTNFDGEFSFADVKPGEYKVNTKYISYKNSTLKTIKVQNNEIHSLNVELQPEAKETTVLAATKSIELVTVENNETSKQFANK